MEEATDNNVEGILWEEVGAWLEYAKGLGKRVISRVSELVEKEDSGNFSGEVMEELEASSSGFLAVKLAAENHIRLISRIPVNQRTRKYNALLKKARKTSEFCDNMFREAARKAHKAWWLYSGVPSKEPLRDHWFRKVNNPERLSTHFLNVLEGWEKDLRVTTHEQIQGPLHEGVQHLLSILNEAMTKCTALVSAARRCIRSFQQVPLAERSAGYGELVRDITVLEESATVLLGYLIQETERISPQTPKPRTVKE